MDNPFWDAVSEFAKPSDWPPGGTMLERCGPDMAFDAEAWMRRDQMVDKFSWTVTDPDSVLFVASYASDGKIVDPMAGTGYWGYLLGQLGISVVCYDLHPPGAQINHWHKSGEYHTLVEEMDCEKSVRLHSDRTLLLCWPPYSTNDAHRALRAYEGDRVIYIGEGPGGCTGDDQFHDQLASEWVEVDSRRPVQWWGIHDWITVFDRKKR